MRRSKQALLTGAHQNPADISLSRLLAVSSVLIPVAISTAGQLSAVDLAYQVRVGEMLLDTGQIARTDMLTSSAAGLPWLNQQWGAQLLFASAFRAFGWAGLAATRSMVSLGVLTFLYLACRQAGASRRGSAWLTLGSAALLLGGLQLRSELLGMLCFSITAWAAAGRRGHPVRAWLAVPVVAAWANTHGSFVLGPLLLGLFWLQDVRSDPAGARRTLGVAAAALGATALTPFGPRVWAYVAELSADGTVRGFVREWQPTTPATYTGAVFFLSVALIGVALFRRRAGLEWITVLGLAVLGALALSSLRAVTWWALGAPVLLAPLAATAGSGRPDPRLRVHSVLLLVLATIAVAPLARWLPYTGRDAPDGLVRYAPRDITGQLENLLAPGQRFFNAQAWGSWFELALPDNPVLVDSRFEVVPDETWDAYRRVSRGEAGWQTQLDRWAVDVAVLSRLQQSALLPLMRADPGWLLRYEDDDGAIFVRAPGSG